MNKIGENQCRDILDSFAWDSTGYKESAGIRAREREDSHIFYFRDWFNIVTGNGLREGRIMKIYQNTFGSRTKNEEDANVILCCNPFDFDTYYILCREKSREERKKRLLAEYYIRGIFSPGYFDVQGYKQCKTYADTINFLDNYEDVDRALVPKDLVIYEKDRHGELIPKGVVKDERLIAKQVRRCTNLGEDYNRESLYDTVEDYLQNGEDLVIEPSKQSQADAVVDYLKYLNLEQRIIQLHAQGLELKTEENALQDEISSLKQKLQLLQEKHRTKQQERSNLQQEENKLQQEQDNLLR